MERRSFIIGGAALVAAPMIVRASSLMPVNASLMPGDGNTMLTIDEITREAVRLFSRSNLFLRQIDEQYADNFASGIGKQLRIRLPNDFIVSDGPRDIAAYHSDTRHWTTMDVPRVPDVVAPLALVAAAVVIAPQVLSKPVTRRFWSK